MPQPLPSIIDLGRLANAAGMACDPDPPQPDDDKGRRALLCNREVALRDLLLTFRAKTLSDAAAQLFAAFVASEDLMNFELPAEARIRDTVSVRRALLSAIPVVAKAASLDLAEIGAEYIPDFATREFPVGG